MKRLFVMVLTITLLLRTVTNVYANEEVVFSDLESNHWAYENVMELVEMGVINGYPDGAFGPNDTVTSEQFIKMLVSVMGYRNLEANGKDWSKPYLMKAKELGIIDDSAKFFGKSYKNVEITREEMSDLAIRADEQLNATTGLNVLDSTLGAISDIKNVADNLVDSVAKAYQLGILTGYTDGSFKPKATLTRAEAATVIMRIYDVSKRIPYEPANEQVDVVGEEMEYKYTIEEIMDFPNEMFNDRNDNFRYEDGLFHVYKYTGEKLYTLTEEETKVVVRFLRTMASVLDFDEGLDLFLNYGTANDFTEVTCVYMIVQANQAGAFFIYEMPVNGRKYAYSNLTGVSKSFDSKVLVEGLYEASARIEDDDVIFVRGEVNLHQQRYVDYFKDFLSVFYPEDYEYLSEFMVDTVLDWKVSDEIMGVAKTKVLNNYSIDYGIFSEYQFDLTKK